MIFLWSAVLYADEEHLSIIKYEEAVYFCDNGDRITVHYYKLSDDSLSFVKVFLPHGKEYTLPQVLSASGAKYSDDMELILWVKGDKILLEIRNEEGEWQSLYNECTLTIDKRL